MLNSIRYLFKLLAIFYTISKHRLFTNPTSIHNKHRISVWFILIKFCSVIIYPKNLLATPSKPFGERLANCLVELGPIYIKFGQTLSTRPDLIGCEIAEHFKYLQDQLPPFDGKIAKDIIQNHFHKKIEDLFVEFNDIAIAAASIAQVHKARLHTGEYVAIKILRPQIFTRYSDDLLFLEYCAKLILILIPSSRRLKPREIVDFFKTIMRSELDLRVEAASASKMHENFIEDATIQIPEVHWNLTCKNILTIEWLDAVSIYNKTQITEWGLDPRILSQQIAIMFFNQAYRDGFFHADLHPGNILVSKEGKIILIDFGIMGVLLDNDRFAIAEILHGFLTKNYKRVADIHHKIGYIPSDTNLEYFAQRCRMIAEPIMGLAIQDVSIGRLLSELFKITEEFGMETQIQLLLLQKTMVMVEGIGCSLDDQTNMWQLAEPWIAKWANQNLSPEAKFLRYIHKIIKKIISSDYL